MPTVSDVSAWLDRFAPRHLAESWDNVGLLWGDPSALAGRVMTCLTVTPSTADEAIAAGAGLIVSHHPILFKPVKAIRADRPDTGFLWRMARAGVAVLSPHTALDNTVGGMNDGLASRMGLVEVGPLRPTAAPSLSKIVVFAPDPDRDAVMDAAFAAGAGKLGAYERCTFATRGRGSFVGMEGARPTIGVVGKVEEVEEWRIEMICPAAKVAGAVAAIRAAHSYEEPAIDVFALAMPGGGPGIGRLGRLREPETLGGFAARVQSQLAAPGLQFAGDPDRPVSRVAIACGAGDDFLGDAHAAGADVLVTGEARFHRALEAEALGIGLVVAGHHATERPGVEDLADRLREAFAPGVTVWASEVERDPLKTIAGGTRGIHHGGTEDTEKNRKNRE